MREHATWKQGQARRRKMLDGKAKRKGTITGRQTCGGCGQLHSTWKPYDRGDRKKEGGGVRGRDKVGVRGHKPPHAPLQIKRPPQQNVVPHTGIHEPRLLGGVTARARERV